MSTWAIKGVDFRSLISFKNQLFDSPALNSENCIPMDEYKRIRNKHEDAMIQAEVGGTDQMIFKAMGAAVRCFAGKIQSQFGPIHLTTSDTKYIFRYFN